MPTLRSAFLTISPTVPATAHRLRRLCAQWAGWAIGLVAAAAVTTAPAKAGTVFFSYETLTPNAGLAWGSACDSCPAGPGVFSSTYPAAYGKSQLVLGDGSYAQVGSFVSGFAFYADHIGPSSYAQAQSQSSTTTLEAIAAIQYFSTGPGWFDIDYRGYAFSAIGSLATWAFKVGEDPPTVGEEFDSTFGLIGIGAHYIDSFANQDLYVQADGESLWQYCGDTCGYPPGIDQPLYRPAGFTEVCALDFFGGACSKTSLPRVSSTLNGSYEGTERFFAPSGQFVLYIAVMATGAGASAYIDPTITVDPSNPNITLTSMAGPNPTPDAPFLSADQLAALTPDELNALGLSPAAATPEPSQFILCGAGLIMILTCRARRRAASSHSRQDK